MNLKIPEGQSADRPRPMKAAQDLGPCQGGAGSPPRLHQPGIHWKGINFGGSAWVLCDSGSWPRNKGDLGSPVPHHPAPFSQQLKLQPWRSKTQAPTQCHKGLTQALLFPKPFEGCVVTSAMPQEPLGLAQEAREGGS